MRPCHLVDLMRQLAVEDLWMCLGLQPKNTRAELLFQEVQSDWKDNSFISRWEVVSNMCNKYVSEGDWRISTHADSMERRISSVKFTSAHLIWCNVYIPVGVARALADSSNFGLLREQSSQEFVIPCLGRRWTAEQNVTLLALSAAWNPYPNKQTVNDIFTLPVGMCGLL